MEAVFCCQGGGGPAEEPVDLFDENEVLISILAGRFHTTETRLSAFRAQSLKADSMSVQDKCQTQLLSKNLSICGVYNFLNKCESSSL